MALDREKLVLPEGMELRQARNLFNKLGRRKKWNVKLKETYSYGEGVLIYLARCREILGQPPLEDPEFLDWQTLWQERSDEHPDCCPVCGKRLITLETFAPVKRRLCMRNKDPDIVYEHAA